MYERLGSTATWGRELEPRVNDIPDSRVGSWLAEFATFESAEAWVQLEKGLGHGCLSERSFALTRKWAPAYFAGWTYKEES